MYSTSWYKRLLRPMGVEIKRFDFGLDPWADLSELYRAKPPRVLFDVGANRGQTSLQLASLFPRAHIFTFEPNTNIFPDLQRAVSHLPQVEALPLAFGETGSRIELNVCGSSLNSSILEYARADGEDKIVEKIEVQMDTVDHFCAGRGIEAIDLLKSDVQGYDLNVLKGANSMLEAGRVHAVFCEVNFHKLYEGQCSFEELYAFLAGHGFALCGFYDVVREEGFHIHWADALFIRPGHFGKRQRG